ncbi:expressed unknown protein [Seminavis robusta]|uniref:Uncharacterized protein n=1 Tax=Seminavis robusta TaxID=568900 RepID=A0A9N8H2A5_9STRA|nr:expressed unknown protein [Seminavis robusta]|eukprot:Sro60_g034710.1 n/a (179) ;mRNA; f:78055-78591
MNKLQMLLMLAIACISAQMVSADYYIWYKWAAKTGRECDDEDLKTLEDLTRKSIIENSDGDEKAFASSGTWRELRLGDLIEEPVVQVTASDPELDEFTRRLQPCSGCECCAYFPGNPIYCGGNCGGRRRNRRLRVRANNERELSNVMGAVASAAAKWDKDTKDCFDPSSFEYEFERQP